MTAVGHTCGDCGWLVMIGWLSATRGVCSAQDVPEGLAMRARKRPACPQWMEDRRGLDGDVSGTEGGAE